MKYSWLAIVIILLILIIFLTNNSLAWIGLAGIVGYLVGSKSSLFEFREEYPVDGAVLSGGWEPEGLQSFTNAYKRGKIGHKTESMVLEIINAYVDRGRFETAKPEWLRASDQEVLGNAGGSVTLELDGYNPEIEMCLEYNGPVHYATTHTEGKEYDSWIRGRKNDMIKKKAVLDAGKKLMIVHCGIEDNYKKMMGLEELSISDKAVMYARYIMSRLADMGHLRNPTGTVWTPEEQKAYLKALKIYYGILNEPSLGKYKNVIERYVVNREMHLTIPAHKLKEMERVRREREKKQALREEQEKNRRAREERRGVRN